MGLLGIVALLVGTAAGAGLLVWAESRLNRIDIEGISPVGEAGELEGYEEVDLEQVVNVLLVGTDERAGLTPAQRRELGTGDFEGTRTDTIMLVRLDPTQDGVSILSFPRDLLVTRCDGSRGRINAAYQVGEQTGVGGPSCLVQTVTEFSGLPVHHFVAVDFGGFVQLVNLVGGVNVYLEQPIDDWRANLELEAGCHRLEGATALGFVRHRASDSDYGRAARQQRFVKELIREATSLGNIVNVPRLLRMIDTGARAVQTDQDLSLDQMRRIAFTFRELEGDSVVARTVPGELQRIDGVAFEVPIQAEAEALFAAFQAGAFHERPAGSDAEPGLSPADVPAVDVRNAAGINGLAASAKERLEASGFTVAEVGNAEEFDREVTEIRHPARLAEEAALLAEQFPGAELVEEPRLDIQVQLGADYDPDARPIASADADAGPGDAAADAAGALPGVGGEFIGAGPPPARCYE